LLADFFEDTADGVFPAGSDASRKETAFALGYTAKEADIIPDCIPEIGYADDSLIVRTVHEEMFHDYCRFRKIRWSFVKIDFTTVLTTASSRSQNHNLLHGAQLGNALRAFKN
jgi:hypothetical protein